MVAVIQVIRETEYDMVIVVVMVIVFTTVIFTIGAAGLQSGLAEILACKWVSCAPHCWPSS